QEAFGIDGFTRDARFIVEMRTRRASRGTYPADDLADLDDLSDADLDLREVAIAGRQSVPVIDFHHVAIAAAPFGMSDRAVGGDANGITDIATEIHAGMHGRSAEERIDAHAES